MRSIFFPSLTNMIALALSYAVMGMGRQPNGHKTRIILAFFPLRLA